MRAITERRWQGNYVLNRESGEYVPEGKGFDFGGLPSLGDPLD
jgi:hypothetical protein